MIISFLVRNFRYIIDALILAAIIVVFVIFDPLKLFNTGVNVRNTPVSVQSIRQIGQLITAEYYGEEIASLSDCYKDTVDRKVIDDNGHDLFKDLFASFDSLKKTEKHGWITFNKINKNNIERQIEDKYPWITRNRIYPLLMSYLIDIIKNKTNTDYDSKKILWVLFEKGFIKENTLRIDSNFTLTNFSAYVNIKDSLSFKEPKKNIVYIGRGWVKAGIDFGKLRPEDIFYNSGNKTLYIKHCEPEILDCDINPWFIPNKVKGFELIKQKGTFDSIFKIAVKVKIVCKEKLRMQAIKSGIILQARENARESLMNLFSLIMGSQINQVVFSKNIFEQDLHEILKDSVINNQEAIFINDLTAKSLIKLDTTYYSDYRMQLADLRDFCDKLQSYKYAGSQVNGFSLEMADYLQNDQIDTIEFRKAFSTLCSVPSSDLVDKNSKIFRLLADYKSTPNKFIDDCIANSLDLKQDTTGFQHRLSMLTEGYRDKLYKKGLQICTDSVKRKGNNYAIWFKTAAGCDSARFKVAKYIIAHSDTIVLTEDFLNKIMKHHFFGNPLPADSLNKYFSERLKRTAH